MLEVSCNFILQSESVAPLPELPPKILEHGKIVGGGLGWINTPLSPNLDTLADIASLQTPSTAFQFCLYIFAHHHGWYGCRPSLCCTGKKQRWCERRKEEIWSQKGVWSFYVPVVIGCLSISLTIYLTWTICSGTQYPCGHGILS